MNIPGFHTQSIHKEGVHINQAFHGMGVNVKNWAGYIARRRDFRCVFVPLLEERDQILSDIGYQRRDIEKALELPLSQDAMKFIELKRSSR